MHDIKKLIDVYITRYNIKDVDSFLELFTEDVVFESVSNTGGTIVTKSKAELEALARESAEYFDEREQKVTSCIVSGSSAAAEIEYWCRFAKDLPGGKKAGEEMHIRGASFFEFRESKICRLTDYM